MSDKLVTVATYWNSIEAGLARGRLEAAGIRAFLADEQMVGTAWYLGNAIGGAKLQVGDSDAHAALEILSDDATIDEADDSAVDEDYANDEDAHTIDDKALAELEDDTSREPDRPLTSREENADRAYRGAIIGLLLFPLQFYVFWLLLKVFVASDEPLRPSLRRAAIWAAVINIPSVIAIAFFLRVLYQF